MPIATVNDKTFEQQVLQSPLPVLVELFASWCQPCKQLAPIVESVAEELKDALRVVKVDVDASPAVAQALRAQSIPMLVLFNAGRPVDQHVGVMDRHALLQWCERVLPRSEAELKPAELAALLQQGRVQPVDIRDAASFARYRIPGSIHIAAGDVVDKAQSLSPADGRLRILYSRSNDDAKSLCDSLREHGVEVGYLSGGFLHWEAEGLPTESG